MEITERARLMIAAYGEAMKKTTAAKLVSRSPTTIKAMLNDGRLTPACDGTRVDTYSLAEYISSPRAIDSEARMRKRYPDSQFRV